MIKIQTRQQVGEYGTGEDKQKHKKTKRQSRNLSFHICRCNGANFLYIVIHLPTHIFTNPTLISKNTKSKFSITEKTSPKLYLPHVLI